VVCAALITLCKAFACPANTHTHITPKGTDSIRRARLRDGTERPIRWYALDAAGLPASALREGGRYYVVVAATNRAGPPLSANASSAAFLVNATPPAPGIVYNT
jgi:hypothetical protein